MKKCFFFVAIALASLLANASTGIKWSCYTVYQSGTTTKLDEGCAAYLIDVAQLTQQNILDAVCGGSSLAEAIGSKYVINSSVDDSGMVIVSTAGAVDVYAAGAKVTFFSVIANADGSELFFGSSLPAPAEISGTGATTITTVPTIASANAVFDPGTTFAVGGDGWYSTASVPEPTSGLLLLLGFSALALRRKRA